MAPALALVLALVLVRWYSERVGGRHKGPGGGSSSGGREEGCVRGCVLEGGGY